MFICSCTKLSIEHRGCIYANVYTLLLISQKVLITSVFLKTLSRNVSLTEAPCGYQYLINDVDHLHAHARRSSVCSCVFYPDRAEGAADPPSPISVSSSSSTDHSLGELCFLQPTRLIEWSGKATWRTFEGHIPLDFMSSSGACVGDKESPHFPYRQIWR